MIMMKPSERVLTISRRNVPGRVPKVVDYRSFVQGLMIKFKKNTKIRVNRNPTLKFYLSRKRHDKRRVYARPCYLI